MNRGKEPRFGKHVLVVDAEEGGGGCEALMMSGSKLSQQNKHFEVHFEIQLNSTSDCSQPSIGHF